MCTASRRLSIRRVLGPFQQSPTAQGFRRIVTHLAFCWLASTAVVIGWHVPALFELGMQSAGWHLAEHLSFLAAGLLFWWPVVQPWPSLERWPRWHIPLYLFLATLPCDALSAFLAFCNRVVYAHYQTARPLFDFSPLERPGVRRAHDLGCRDVRLSDPRGGSYYPAPFAAETYLAIRSHQTTSLSVGLALQETACLRARLSNVQSRDRKGAEVTVVCSLRPA